MKMEGERVTGGGGGGEAEKNKDLQGLATPGGDEAEGGGGQQGGVVGVGGDGGKGGVTPMIAATTKFQQATTAGKGETSPGGGESFPILTDGNGGTFILVPVLAPSPFREGVKGMMEVDVERSVTPQQPTSSTGKGHDEATQDQDNAKDVAIQKETATRSAEDNSSFPDSTTTTVTAGQAEGGLPSSGSVVEAQTEQGSGVLLPPPPPIYVKPMEIEVPAGGMKTRSSAKIGGSFPINEEETTGPRILRRKRKAPVPAPTMTMVSPDKVAIIIDAVAKQPKPKKKKGKAKVASVAPIDSTGSDSAPAMESELPPPPPAPVTNDQPTLTPPIQPKPKPAQSSTSTEPPVPQERSPPPMIDLVSDSDGEDDPMKGPAKSSPRKCVVCLEDSNFVEDLFEWGPGMGNGTSGGVGQNPKVAYMTDLISQLGMSIQFPVRPREVGICLPCLNSLESFDGYRCMIMERRQSAEARTTPSPSRFFESSRPHPGKVAVPRNPDWIRKVNQVIKSATHHHYARRQLSETDWNFIYDNLPCFTSTGNRTLESFISSPEKLSQLYCVICKRIVGDGREGFIEHAASMHPGQAIRLPCEICGGLYFETGFRSGGSTGHEGYLQHWISHFCSVQCTICGVKFPSEASLLQHRQSGHNVGVNVPRIIISPRDARTRGKDTVPPGPSLLPRPQPSSSSEPSNVITPTAPSVAMATPSSSLSKQGSTIMNVRNDHLGTAGNGIGPQFVTIRPIKDVEWLKKVELVQASATHTHFVRRHLNEGDWDFVGDMLFGPGSKTLEKDGCLSGLEEYINSIEKLSGLHCILCMKMVEGGRNGFVSHRHLQHPDRPVRLPCEICGDHFPLGGGGGGGGSQSAYFLHWLSHFWVGDKGAKLAPPPGNPLQKFQNRETKPAPKSSSFPSATCEGLSIEMETVSIATTPSEPNDDDNDQEDQGAGQSKAMSVPEYFNCSICGRGYKTEHWLREHQAGKCSWSKECNVCGKVFKRSNALKEHQVRAAQTEANISSGKDTRTRQHRCPLCKELFATRCTLLGHLKIAHKITGFPDSNAGKKEGAGLKKGGSSSKQFQLKQPSTSKLVVAKKTCQNPSAKKKVTLTAVTVAHATNQAPGVTGTNMQDCSSGNDSGNRTPMLMLVGEAPTYVHVLPSTSPQIVDAQQEEEDGQGHGP